MEIIEYKDNKVHKYGLIRDGVAGNYDIVYRMIDLVRDTVLLDKGFEDFVKQTVINNGFDSYSNKEDLFNFLYNFIQQGDADIDFDGIAYIQDIQGKTESIKNARTTLADGYGDCDDHAILMASMLAVLGFEPCFTIAKYHDANSFEHIYTTLKVDNKRYVFDTTYPNGTLNSEISDNEVTKEDVCIFSQNANTDGLSSAIRNIKYLLIDTKRNAQESLPLLSGIIPFGFIGHSVVSSLFSGLEQSESLSEIGSRLTGRLTDIIIELQNNRIPVSRAQSLARKVYSELYAAEAGTLDKESFNIIKKRLDKKLQYINNYSLVKDTYSVALPFDIKYLIGIGVVGFGAYYLYSKGK